MISSWSTSWTVQELADSLKVHDKFMIHIMNTSRKFKNVSDVLKVHEQFMNTVGAQFTSRSSWTNFMSCLSPVHELFMNKFMILFMNKFMNCSWRKNGHFMNLQFMNLFMNLFTSKFMNKFMKCSWTNSWNVHEGPCEKGSWISWISSWINFNPNVDRYTDSQQTDITIL